MPPRAEYVGLNEYQNHFEVALEVYEVHQYHPNEALIWPYIPQEASVKEPPNPGVQPQGYNPEPLESWSPSGSAGCVGRSRPPRRPSQPENTSQDAESIVNTSGKPKDVALICIYIYKYMYICMYSCVCICMSIYLYILYMCACVSIFFVYMCIYIYICLFVNSS